MNEIRIAWGVTGSGTFIRDIFKLMLELKSRFKEFKISTYLSRAAEEVIRIYGLLKYLNLISPGGYYEEVITEDIAGKSCVYSGRFNMGRYRMLVIAPATSNTVAKIVYGIADTIVTTIAAQALKSNTPLLILPSDVSTETEVPCYIDRVICNKCMRCINICPYNAIELIDEYPRINLLKCYGCRVCEENCPVNAIKCFHKIRITIRDIDSENIKRLTMMNNVTVVDNVRELESKILELAGVK